jgi:hypothetical protein
MLRLCLSVHVLIVLVCFLFWICREHFMVSLTLSVDDGSNYIYCICFEHFIVSLFLSVTSSFDSASLCYLFYICSVHFIASLCLC